MYLVLTALLALNVSKDILQAFVVVNGSLERTNENFKQKTDGQYSAFDHAKMIDPKKVKANWDKAQAVKQLSKELVAYIEGIKKKLMGRTDGLSDTQADSVHLNYINSKDNYDIPTNIMIGESEDGSAGLSHELKTKLLDFKNKLYGFIDARDRKDIHLGINTDDPKKSESNENWELYNFYHTPLVASVTILSKLQNDVKKSESDVVEYLYRQVNIDDFVFDTVAAKVITPTNYVLLGDEYNADVFVAAFSKTQNPKVLVGDYDMEQHKFTGTSDSIYVEKGSGRYKVKPTHEGIYKWGGEVTLISPQGNKRVYPFQSEYIVARPSLTVSADKMNVFYTGVENPVSISVPGIANENVTVSIDNGTITRTGDGKYSVKVFNGTKAIIRVSGKMQDGESRSMGSVEYRVKQLPDPIPGIGHQKGSGKIPYSELIAQQGMYVAYDDNFEFKASAQIYSFKMIITTVNGDLSLNSDGPRFTQQMKDAMKKLRRGNKVYFENIVAEGPDKKKRDLTMTLTIQ